MSLVSCECRVRGLSFEGFEDFEEGGEPDEEFSGDGDEGDFARIFAFFAESFEEGGEVGAVLGGGVGGHEEGIADDGAAALAVFEFSQKIPEIWRGSKMLEERRILETVSLNRLLGDVTLGSLDIHRKWMRSDASQTNPRKVSGSLS